MNWKTVGLQAAAVAVASATVATAPAAEAVSLRGSVGLTGNTAVTVNTVSFNAARVETASGDFSPSLLGKTVGIKPLTINPALVDNFIGTESGRSVAATNGFIDFGTVTLKGQTNNLLFNLFASNDVETKAFGTGNLRNISHSFRPIEGEFVFGGKTLAQGFLNTSRSGRDINGGTFQATLTAIPTPAMLPGLIGLGLSAWRKRKQDPALEAEQAGTKA